MQPVSGTKQNMALAMYEGVMSWSDWIEYHPFSLFSAKLGANFFDVELILYIIKNLNLFVIISVNTSQIENAHLTVSTSESWLWSLAVVPTTCDKC
jgi:hypothetical protein